LALDVYAAATVIIAARICHPLHLDISNASLKDSWLRCLEILKTNAEISKSARRCIAALEFLDQHIVVEQSDGNIASRQSVQAANSNAETQLPMASVSAGDPPQVAQRLVFHDTLQASNEEFSNLMDDQDVTWLHSVPMDLLQLDSGDIFGRSAGPFHRDFSAYGGFM